jgi:hypothetical protein
MSSYVSTSGVTIEKSCDCAQCGNPLPVGANAVRVVKEGGVGETLYFCDFACEDAKMHGVTDEPYCKAHPD